TRYNATIDTTASGGLSVHLSWKIRPNSYFDSIDLMRVAEQTRQLAGVTEVAVVMGTPTGRAMLAEAAMWPAEAPEGTPSDLLVAVRASGEVVARHALARVDDLLSAGRDAGPARAAPVPRAPRRRRVHPRVADRVQARVTSRRRRRAQGRRRGQETRRGLPARLRRTGARWRARGDDAGGGGGHRGEPRWRGGRRARAVCTGDARWRARRGARTLCGRHALRRGAPHRGRGPARLRGLRRRGVHARAAAPDHRS